jgi:hypothetical protein
VLVVAHDHGYQRWAPLNPLKQVDRTRGVREFVVGMGGKDLYPISPMSSPLEAWTDGTFGVLELTLSPGSYSWQFLRESGKDFTDAGSSVCH